MGAVSDTINKAVRRCDLRAIRRFLEVEGVDVNCRDDEGNTPLISAAFPVTNKNTPPSLNLDVISFLISKNADVDATLGDGALRWCSGCTALMIASRYGNLEIVRMLLESGDADVNHSIPGSGHTALTLASSHQSGLCVVTTLLEHGANANPRLVGLDWDPPLMEACKFQGSSNVVRKLLECGANVDATGEYGTTALHHAVTSSDKAAVQLLIANGANVNAHAQLGRISFKTPLSRAVTRGNVAILRALLGHDAKIDFIFEDGSSVLHLKRHPKILGLLLAHCRSTMTEAKFDNLLLLADDAGDIALHRAKTVQVAKLFIEQPRRHDMHLLPMCHSQIARENRRGRHVHQDGRHMQEVAAYLKSFESLVLAIPGGVTRVSAKRRKTMNEEIALKLNPNLNDFQRSVAEEAMLLVVEAMDCPDCMTYAILGYLSPLDVMKRSHKTTA